MQQEINTLLLKGITLFGDLHYTGTLLEIQAMPDLNILKSCSRDQSWILNTYFKNKLPSSERKLCLNTGDAPKATCTSFSSCFLGKQATGITWAPLQHFHYQWGKEVEGSQLPQKGGQAGCVGKAPGECHGSQPQCAFEE